MRITNRYGLPEVIRRAVEKDEYDGPSWSEWPHKIGVSTLIDPPRIAVLKHLNDDQLEQDVSDCLFMLQGKAMHWVLEQGRSPEGLYEVRLETKFDKTIISGQIDQWEAGVVRDYKNSNSRFQEKWALQLQVYALLCQHHGIDVEALEIVALRPMSGKIDVFPVRLWPDLEAYDYAMKRIDMHWAAFETLPLCTPEETWDWKRCPKYCLVSRFCTQYLDKQDKK